MSASRQPTSPSPIGRAQGAHPRLRSVQVTWIPVTVATGPGGSSVVATCEAVYRALQLRVRVEVSMLPSAKPKLVRASGKLAPGNPFGAGQPELM